jgi:hypothetical protein
MTPKQMYHAMRKWGISLVFDPNDELWWAGEVKGRVNYGLTQDFTIQAGISGMTMHISQNPESAVEDYCNARNLEWDI